MNTLPYCELKHALWKIRTQNKRKSGISIVTFKIGFNNVTNFEERKESVILILHVVHSAGGNQGNQVKEGSEAPEIPMTHTNETEHWLKELGGKSGKPKLSWGKREISKGDIHRMMRD